MGRLWKWQTFQHNLLHVHLHYFQKFTLLTLLVIAVEGPGEEFEPYTHDQNVLHYNKGRQEESTTMSWRTSCGGRPDQLGKADNYRTLRVVNVPARFYFYQQSKSGVTVLLKLTRLPADSNPNPNILQTRSWILTHNIWGCPSIYAPKGCHSTLNIINRTWVKIVSLKSLCYVILNMACNDLVA